MNHPPIVATLLCTLIFSTNATAQDRSCEGALWAYENAMKESAEIDAQDIGDDSAPRATMRYAKQQKLASIAQVNLTLMLAKKCPLPRTAYNPNYYYKQATDCRLARIKADKDGIEANCLVTNWKPNDK